MNCYDEIAVLKKEREKSATISASGSIKRGQFQVPHTERLTNVCGLCEGCLGDSELFLVCGSEELFICPLNMSELH